MATLCQGGQVMASDIRSLIRARLNELGWSQGELSRRCGMAPPDLSRYFSEKRDVTGATLDRLVEALGGWDAVVGTAKRDEGAAKSDQ